MQQNYFHYEKENYNLEIGRMPIWFKETEAQGSSEEGNITLKSQNDYDEIWGPNAKFEISWITKERTKFFHAREVEETIEMYNAIDFVITNKEQNWLRTHEFTVWFGNRTKMIRKRYYPENAIHGLFYCELTNRLFNLHASVIRKHYEGFRPYILEGFNSFICHQ